MPAATEAQSSVGITIRISDEKPATHTGTAFAALTDWTELAEVDSLGDYGPTTSVNTRQNLKTGVVQKIAGATDYGQISLEGAMMFGDEGNTKFEDARKERRSLSVEVEYPDGVKEYMRGIPTSNVRKPGDANSFVGNSKAIDVSTELVTVIPA